jgi:hypothetical protein
MVLGSGIRDPRSGIRKKTIPDPGSMGQKGTGSRIPDPRSGSATLLKIVGNEKGGGVAKQATVRIWFRTVAIDVC